MVVLKKIRASTTVEIVVATVILLVLFFIASMSINNVFSATISKHDLELRQIRKEVKYNIFNEVISLPYTSESESWLISVQKIEDSVIFNAKNMKSNKNYTDVWYLEK